MNRLKRNTQPSLIEQLSGMGSPTQFSRPIAWAHTFYLVGPVEEPSKYTEWFEMIRTADTNDQIIININSPGGNYATALQFRRVIMESAATVVCCIEGECHSAASIIFLSGKAFSVSEGSNMLLHDYSGIVGGKGSEMIRQIQHEKVSIDAFLADVYEHFLNPAELEKVLSGQDMWLDWENIMERITVMVDVRDAEFMEEQEQEQVIVPEKKPATRKKTTKQ